MTGTPCHTQMAVHSRNVSWVKITKHKIKRSYDIFSLVKSMVDEMESSEDEGEISKEEQKGERGRRIRKHMSRMQRAMKAQTSGLMWRIASFSEVGCEVDDV